MVREEEGVGTAQLDDGSSGSSGGDKNKKEQVIGKR